MKISVIIPHQNKRPEWLKEAKNSLKNQTFQDFELIEEIGEGYEKLNTGILKSKGKYIVFLSDDDIFPPDFLEKCVNFIEKEQLDIVSPGIKNFGDVPNHSTETHLSELYPFFSSLFTRSIYDKVKGFDHSMREVIDVDFWYRCIESGAKWAVCPDTVYLYRNHVNQDSVKCNWEEARKRLFNKHKNYKW